MPVPGGEPASAASVASPAPRLQPGFQHRVPASRGSRPAPPALAQRRPGCAPGTAAHSRAQPQRRRQPRPDRGSRSALVWRHHPGQLRVCRASASLPGRGLGAALAAGPALTHFQRGGPPAPHVWRPRLPRAFLGAAFPAAAAMGLTRQYLRYEPAALFGLVASARAGVAFVALRGERGRYVAVPACEHVFVWDTRKGEKVGAGMRCRGAVGGGAGLGCSVRGFWAAWSEAICAAERRSEGNDTSTACPPLGKGEHSVRVGYGVSLALAASWPIVPVSSSSPSWSLD